MGDEEVWKDIDGHPGYAVSNLGRVLSKARTVNGRNGGRRPVRERILKQAMGGGVPGHRRLQVALGHGNSSQVHVLVCVAFHGPNPSPEHQAAHWDGKPLNNRWDNLRWATPLENAEDRERHGTAPIGSQNPFAKLTEADIVDIRAMRARGLTLKAIGDAKGVRLTTIWWITTGKAWKHVA